MPIRIAIVGVGKIARDEHVPAIAADDRYQLAAVTSSADPGLGVPWFAKPVELFAGMKGRLDAVAICTPPGPRYAIARDALEAGYDVLLEKPPAATLGQIEHLDAIARERERVLYASWHSQHAAGVARAAEALAGQAVTRLCISWIESVRKYHAGQEWIWAPGGFGVFDPGINGLSIATRILPMPLFVREARLLVPSNKQAPIAATISFGEGLDGTFDWRFEEGEDWRIRVETQAGRVVELCNGGARLYLDDVEQVLGSHAEYRGIYDRFAGLVAERRSEVDREPLRIVADAFLVGHRELIEPFA